MKKNIITIIIIIFVIPFLIFLLNRYLSIYISDVGKYFLKLEQKNQVAIIQTLIASIVACIPILIYYLNKRWEQKFKLYEIRRKYYANYLKKLNFIISSIKIDDFCNVDKFDFLTKVYRNNNDIALYVSKKLSIKITKLTNILSHILLDENFTEKEYEKTTADFILALICEIILQMRKESDTNSDELLMRNFLALITKNNVYLYDEETHMSRNPVAYSTILEKKTKKNLHHTIKEIDKLEKDRKRKLKKYDKQLLKFRKQSITVNTEDTEDTEDTDKMYNSELDEYIANLFEKNND